MKRGKQRGRIIGRAVVIAFAVAAVMAVGGASAYFTATDHKDNTWTVGNVEIQLQEPKYDAAESERSAITPNMDLTKDPQVLNSGVNDAFVFMRISIPKANVKVASQDGSTFDQAQQELFDYSFDDNWAIVNKVESKDSNSYVCVYGTKTKCKALAAGQKTSTLFKNGKIRFKNVLEGQGLESTTLTMPVEAFAIQTKDITESDTDVPADVWNVLNK